MSTVYTLKDLLKDCSNNNRNRTRGTVKEKQVIFKNTWDALNAWILSRFEIGKGVSVGNFGKITWEVSNSQSNCQKRRPVFLISESFSKNNGLPYKRILVASELASVEEINFTKLSIKFSENLTKDVIFSATRDILQRIGDVLSTGKRVSIDFSVGRFLAKSRVSHMVFDPRVFPRNNTIVASSHNSLPPPIVLGDLDDYKAADEDDDDDGSGNFEESIPKIASDDSAADVPATTDTTSMNIPTIDTAAAAISSTSTNTTSTDKNNIVVENSARSVSDREAVLDQAYARYVAKLERELELDSLDQLEVHKKHYQDISLVKNEREQKKKAALDVQAGIKSQIQERQQLQRDYSNETEGAGYDQSKVSILPVSPREYDENASTSPTKKAALEKRSMNARVKGEIHKYLQSQIEAKEQLKKDEREQQLRDDNELLNRVQLELRDQKLQDLKDLKEQRRFLTEGWRRDNHVKTMIKMKRRMMNDAIVNGKIQSNDDKKSARNAATPPWREEDSNFSIGFDIRG